MTISLLDWLFGKKKTKTVSSIPRVTFRAVAGNDIRAGDFVYVLPASGVCKVVAYTRMELFIRRIGTLLRLHHMARFNEKTIVIAVADAKRGNTFEH